MENTGLATQFLPSSVITKDPKLIQTSNVPKERQNPFERTPTTSTENREWESTANSQSFICGNCGYVAFGNPEWESGVLKYFSIICCLGQPASSKFQSTYTPKFSSGSRNKSSKTFTTNPSSNSNNITIAFTTITFEGVGTDSNFRHESSTNTQYNCPNQFNYSDESEDQSRHTTTTTSYVFNSPTTLGSNSQNLMCPTCKKVVASYVLKTPKLKTHIYAILLCLLGLCVCSYLLYLDDDLKDIKHYCPYCNTKLEGNRIEESTTFEDHF